MRETEKMGGLDNTGATQDCGNSKNIYLKRYLPEHSRDGWQ